MKPVRKKFLLLFFTAFFLFKLSACDSPSQKSTSADDVEKTSDEIITEIIDHVDNREYDLAMDAIEELDRMEESYTPYKVNYYKAYVEFSTGNLDSALALLNSLNPGRFDSEVLILRGNVYDAMNMPYRAKADYEDSLLANREFADMIRLSLWDTGLILGDADMLRQVEGSLFESETPTDFYSTLALVKRHRLNGENHEAESLVDTIQALPDFQGRNEGYFLRHMWREKAEIVFNEGDYDRAISLLDSAADYFPNDPSAWPLMGSFANQTGHRDDAWQFSLMGLARSHGKEVMQELGLPFENYEDVLTPGLLMRSEAAVNLVNMSEIHLENGDPDKCIHLAEKALEIYPYGETALMMIGLADELKGNYDDALETYHRGMILAPYDTSFQLRYNWVSGNTTHLLSPSYPDADELYNDVIKVYRGHNEHYPDCPQFQFDLGFALLLGEDPSSIEFLEQAYNGMPHITDYYYYFLLAEWLYNPDQIAGTGNPESLPSIRWLHDVYILAEKRKSVALFNLAETYYDLATTTYSKDWSVLDKIREDTSELF